MAKRSVLSRPLPDSSLPRNTFDRSFFKNLNWSAGMIVPAFCQFVPAGSSGQINRSIFMRTNAVNTAAFPKLDTHIDFYKVPLKLLMTRYNEFKLNIQDANSSAFATVGGVQAVPSTMPFFNIGTIYAAYFGPGNTRTDAVGFPEQVGASRLLDLLGYNDNYISRYGSTGSDLPNMNLQTFKLQAYQKAYYDHYRNTAYESNRPQAYNADYLYTQGNANGEYGINEIPDILKIHYVNYRKDFFQNIYPALNYVVSNPSGVDWSLPSDVGGMETRPYVNPSAGNYVWPSFTASSPVSGSPSGNIYPQGALTVQNIRAAFALDKLLRLSAYAPKHVKDQLKARFGVHPSDASSYESQYLGSFMNDVVIGEVTATAATDYTGASGTVSTPLGAIGGRGVGADQRGQDINFNVTGDDGDSIIIGMMYTLARSVYDSFRLDAFNFKFTREDIFVPEFMDLGLRPITLKEIYTPSTGTLTLAQLNTIIGYVPRDQEYKLGIDENHGLFRSGDVLSIFVNHTNVSTVQRGATPGTPGVNYSWFKISPSDLDSIFAQSFNPLSPATDQFFGHIEFKFISRQNMSVHGQPRI